MNQEAPTPGGCFICGQSIEGSELMVLAMQEHAPLSRDNIGPYEHEIVFAHRKCARGVAHAAFVDRLRDP